MRSEISAGLGNVLLQNAEILKKNLDKSAGTCYNVKKPPEAASHGCASGGFAYESKSNCGASVTVRRYSSGSPFKINSA